MKCPHCNQEIKEKKKKGIKRLFVSERDGKTLLKDEFGTFYIKEKGKETAVNKDKIKKVWQQ